MAMPSARRATRVRDQLKQGIWRMNMECDAMRSCASLSQSLDDVKKLTCDDGGGIESGIGAPGEGAPIPTGRNR